MRDYVTYTSISIARTVQSKRLYWLEYRKQGIHAGCWWGNVLKNINLEKLEGNSREILRWILGRQDVRIRR